MRALPQRQWMVSLGTSPLLGAGVGVAWRSDARGQLNTAAKDGSVTESARNHAPMGFSCRGGVVRGHEWAALTDSPRPALCENESRRLRSQVVEETSFLRSRAANDSAPELRAEERGTARASGERTCLFSTEAPGRSVMFLLSRHSTPSCMSAASTQTGTLCSPPSRSRS